jgi:hypothetical protein
MRQHLALALLLGAATSAFAQPAKGRATPKKIDIKPIMKDLVIYKDDIGKYYVVPRPDQHAVSTDSMVFFGDGKSFYKQRVIGYGSSARPEWQADWTLWSPRVKGRIHATLTLTHKELFVHCREREKRPLTQVSEDQTRKMLEKGQFFENFWQRESRMLARDDNGVYFFVDRLTDEAGGGGYRVFVGKKGAMKEQAMTNIVSDSAGDIYSTKTGELKFITENGKAFWKKGGKKSELVVLEPFANRYLIYRELGIYGQLGVVCEDL